MSNIAIQGAATGTGVFTLESPATNTDRVLTLPDEAGTVLTTAGVPASAMPAGSVLQVVSVTSTTPMTTAGAYPQLSGITVSITPQSASSKVFVMAVIQGHADSSGTNANKIAVFGVKNNTSGATFGTRRVGALFNSSFADIFDAVPIIVLDTPNSTSAQTYEILYGRYNSSFDNGVSINGGGLSPATVITLMEIAA